MPKVIRSGSTPSKPELAGAADAKAGHHLVGDEQGTVRMRNLGQKGVESDAVLDGGRDDTHVAGAASVITAAI